MQLVLDLVGYPHIFELLQDQEVPKLFFRLGLTTGETV